MLFDADLMAGENIAFLKEMALIEYVIPLKPGIRFLVRLHPGWGGRYGFKL
jgi:hypothetical protein